MILLRHPEPGRRCFDRPVLTLGNFDGVHRGHQAILHRVVQRAGELGAPGVVFTFHPHPTAVLAPDKAPRLITDLHVRVERIAGCGIDGIILQRFTRAFSRITAEDFVRRILARELGVRAVVVGHRVTFGHQRAGDAELLRRLAASCGFEVEVIGPVQVNGVTVSSSVVRRAIGNGDLQQAADLLGHPVIVAGRVIHGFHRGRTLGFPTANLRLTRLMLPPDGVYAVRARDGAAAYAGIANLGFNPTFALHERSLEAHLFDFDGDLYGHRLEVAFVRRIRSEMKFPNVEALAQQIARDVAAARAALADAGA